MQSELVFAQAIAEFADRLSIAVIEMMGRAENFDRSKAGSRDFGQQRIVQLLIEEAVSGKYALHQKPAVVRDTCEVESPFGARPAERARNPVCALFIATGEVTLRLENAM